MRLFAVANGGAGQSSAMRFAARMSFFLVRRPLLL